MRYSLSSAQSAARSVLSTLVLPSASGVSVKPPSAGATSAAAASDASVSQT